MGSALEQTMKSWDYVFERESSHVPLRRAVADLTAVQAEWKPPNGRNSIWKVVNHLVLWKEALAERLAGGPPRPRGWAKGVDWKEIDEPTEDAWQTSIRRLDEQQARLKAELSKRSDDDFDRPLPGGQVPLYGIVHGLMVHDSYHCGQICHIRALQGVPIKGSWDM